MPAPPLSSFRLQADGDSPPEAPASESRQVTPVVRTILIATVGVFFLQTTTSLVYGLFVLVPAWTLSRPWSVVTYMFLHGGLMHLFFNMLVLFFFGPRVEARLGSRRFAILYFVSGITGALLSIPFSPTAQIVGASAGVFGVMMAFAYYWPDTVIHVWGVLPVPARTLVVITTVLALFSGFSGARDGIAHFAHLGGYLGAYLYLRWIERSRHSFRRKVEAAPAVAKQKSANWKAIDLSKVHEVNRDELNRILDKISSKGLDSLTPQERIFLSNFVPPDDRVPSSH